MILFISHAGLSWDARRKRFHRPERRPSMYCCGRIFSFSFRFLRQTAIDKLVKFLTLFVSPEDLKIVAILK